MASPLVLMVDDEPLILDSMRRALRTGYRILTARSGQEGLEMQRQALTEGTPIEVIVSDMKMPGMDGAQFLAAAKSVDPDAVRIVLSGQADLSSTVAAVNESNLFRFLMKPCEPADLARTLDDAAEQRRLVLAERELLGQTLQGAAETMAQLLALASPEAYGRATRIKDIVGVAADVLGMADDWQLGLAATLCQIGCVAVPPHVLHRVEMGGALSDDEARMYRSHPRTASDLLARIPRLEGVADLVLAQALGPEEEPGADLTPAGRLLYAATAFYAAFEATGDASHALALVGKTEHIDEPTLKALRRAGETLNPDFGVRRSVTAAEIVPGMLLEQDVTTTSGSVLVRKGEWIDDTMATRILNFAKTVGVGEPIPVIQGVSRWRRGSGRSAAGR